MKYFYVDLSMWVWVFFFFFNLLFWTSFRFQRSYKKIAQKVLVYPSLSLSIVSILCDCDSFVKTKKPTLVSYSYLNFQIYYFFHGAAVCSGSLEEPQCTQLSCLLSDLRFFAFPDLKSGFETND